MNGMKVALFFLLFILQPLLASASVSTVDSQGRVKKWDSPQPEFYLRYNNTSGLSSSQVFTVFANALSRWKSIATSNLIFDLWMGSNTISPVVSYDGRNTVYFASQSSSVSLGSGVIGATYVYSSGTQILETDMVFNDNAFTFTLNPSDTTNLSGSSQVFIENVLVHEFGHAYGLSHSSQLQSSMMWQEGRGQSKPSCDDQTGMMKIYSNNGFSNQTGSISGVIRDSSGQNPVFGAHIQAISKRRGVTVAAAITNNTGNFSISGLEPGKYFLFVEPFYSVISSLCGGSAANCYYGGANASTVCSGSSFRRSFIESDHGYGALYDVSAGNNRNVGVYNVSCQSMSQVVAATGSIAGNTPVILPNNRSAVDGAVYGVLSSVGSAHYYKLSQMTGIIKVKAMSFSLYSKADVSVELQDATGTRLGTSAADIFPAGAPVTGIYNNHDSEAQVDLGGQNTDVYVKVNYDRNFATGFTPEGNINLSRYPGPANVDTVPFYFLIATVNDVTPLVLDSQGVEVLSENARCERTDSFAAYPNRGSRLLWRLPVLRPLHPEVVLQVKLCALVAVSFKVHWIPMITVGHSQELHSCSQPGASCCNWSCFKSFYMRSGTSIPRSSHPWVKVLDNALMRWR